MHSREATAGGYIARVIGVAVMLLGACIIAFGGGALYEVLATAFNAGRDVVASDLWNLIR